MEESLDLFYETFKTNEVGRGRVLFCVFFFGQILLRTIETHLKNRLGCFLRVLHFHECMKVYILNCGPLPHYFYF